MTSERALRNAVLKAVSALGARLFRNNVGMAWVGRVERLNPRDIIIRDARTVHFGLCEGSPDLVGWSATGQFIGIELKTCRVAVTADQANFLARVREAGGIAAVARTVEEAVAAVQRRPLVGPPSAPRTRRVSTRDSTGDRPASD